MKTDERGIPIIAQFGCPTCEKHMERGGWFTVACGECGNPIFFKTASAGKAYRRAKDEAELYD